MQTLEHKLFIAGEWVESTGGIAFEDLNPATGELIGNIHQATKENVERAIDAAYLHQREVSGRGSHRDGQPKRAR